MYEEIMHGQYGDAGDPVGTRRRYLYNVVGGPTFPYTLTRDVGGDSGGVRFGDVVVNSDEDVIIANSDASFDQVQDSYADDMLTSGDEGIGFAQARRLKSKLRRNRRRITEQGYAVEASAPYQFGDMGGFSFKKMFTHPFGKKSLFQKAGRAAIKVAPYVAGGIVGGALIKKGVPALFRLGKKVIGGKSQPQPVAVATESPVDVPVPAPTGYVDAAGSPIPASIQQAMTTAASPIPAAAPTASEDVASQAQEAETVSTMEAGAAGVGFTMPNFSDPKVLLTLAALGVFAFTQLSGKKRSGSRSRSRRRR